MGDLLHFPIERTRSRAAPDAARFFFDVRDPASYLMAERIERRLPHAVWVPADARALGALARPSRADVEAEARRLRLPLVWPERFPVETLAAQRAASLACELGAGPAFALAAARLAFCGGFSLEDPDVIAEAAAAAAVPLAACLEAIGDASRDEELRAVSATLRRAGVERLPAIRLGRRWLTGDGALIAATMMLERGRSAAGSLAPVG